MLQEKTLPVRAEIEEQKSAPVPKRKALFYKPGTLCQIEAVPMGPSSSGTSCLSASCFLPYLSYSDGDFEGMHDELLMELT